MWYGNTVPKICLGGTQVSRSAKEEEEEDKEDEEEEEGIWKRKKWWKSVHAPWGKSTYLEILLPGKSIHHQLL